MRILMIGLDGAGKTTILYRLKCGKHVDVIPTIGFNVERLQHRNISFDVGDVCGGEKIRDIGKFYYKETEGIIFVVDSNDLRYRIEEAQGVFHKMLNDDQLRGVPILIFANKQDLPNAMSAAEITEILDLQLIREKNGFIQSTNALSGDGLYEGLEWFAAILKHNK